MFASKDTLLTRPSGYTIARSVRLRSSASAYLNRTFASGNQATWTWSGWVKRGSLGSNQVLFGRQLDGNSIGYIGFTSSNTIEIINKVGPSTGAQVETSAVFRDPAAWYHIVVVYNGSGLTASAMITLYVNSVSQTYASSTRLASGNGYININLSHAIGRREVQNDNYFDGYLTEINFIDGQALTPSSFGETDSITGVWKPKAYSGTYGTNGFELNFSDNSNNTAATIGKDYSGNGNNWTPNNISVTAGTTYDSMVDSPTVGATSSNYAVINPVFKSSSQPTISNGNLTVAPNVATYQNAFSTIGSTSGKQYCEITITGAPNSANMWGVANAAQLNSMTTAVEILGSSALSGTGYGYYYDGRKYSAGTLSSYGSAVSSGDVMGIALDLDNGKVWFSLNGTWQASGDPAAGTNAAFTGIVASGTWFFGATAHSGGSTAYNYNFGQRPFSYTPPTGFVALNTFNLPASTITNGAAYMAATLYTGTGASLTVANTVGSTSFQPDWVWAKSRSAATDHALYDSVRGVQKQIESNSTGAETTETTGLTAFGSTGFTVGALAQMNTSAATYVAWQWKAGTTSASNTNGSITSTVSVGATQGFSVVSFTSPASGSFTVGHGLNAVPNLIITKPTSRSAGWVTYHSSLNGGNPGTSYFVYLDTTAAQASLASPPMWGSAVPTSSVFGASVSATCAGSEPLIAYCFAAVAGYSAFGSYTGANNTGASSPNADGPFVYTGFRPRFVLIKRTSTAASWVIYDSVRGAYNANLPWLYPNTSDAESSTEAIDFLSNGFKIRAESGATMYPDGATFIYACFAESPFKTSLAR